MPIIKSQKITPRAQTIKKHPKTREELVIDSLSPTLNLMVKAVRQAGASLVRDFREVSHLQLSKKGPADFVSNADLWVEKKLIEFLQEVRPDYGIISEECGTIAAKNNSPYCWVMDPIDGTNNFIHAIPFFAISLALTRHNEVIDTVIYNPITNELYYAEKGQGAFVMTPSGSERLRVSTRTKLDTAVVSTNAAAFIKSDALLKAFLTQNIPLRLNGCTTLSLAQVAAGQLDAFVEIQPHLWDVIGGYLLVKEAGGVVQTWSGKHEFSDIMNEKTILLTTPSIKDKVLKLLPKTKKSLQK